MHNVVSDHHVETELPPPSPPEFDPPAFDPLPTRMHLWHALMLLAWGVWWGGLTFYAWLVVPIGTERIGSLDQGFITQRVTWWHNAILIGFVVLLAIDGIGHRASRFWWLWSGLALTALGLCSYHTILSSAMDWDQGTVSEGFYAKHACYLWLTALEWILGIAVLMWLLPRKEQRPAKRER